MERSAAETAENLREKLLGIKLLKPDYQHNEDTITLEYNFKGEVLDVVVDYLNYKVQFNWLSQYYYEVINVPDDMSSCPKFTVKDSLSLDVLIASEELGC